MVEDWDEARDPTRAPKREAPWRDLKQADRLVLDALADGTWLGERPLRRTLQWSWPKFLMVTAKLVLLGIIEARPGKTYFHSEYRLSEEAWQ